MFLGGGEKVKVEIEEGREDIAWKSEWQKHTKVHDDTYDEHGRMLISHAFSIRNDYHIICLLFVSLIFLIFLFKYCTLDDKLMGVN
jgi:hypothetical protein